MLNKAIPLETMNYNIVITKNQSEKSDSTLSQNPLGTIQTTYHGLLCRATRAIDGFKRKQLPD